MYNLIGFVEFHPLGDRAEGLKALPQPTTTKVQYQKDTPVYEEFLRIMEEWRTEKPVKPSAVAAASTSCAATTADGGASETNSVADDTASASTSRLDQRKAELIAANKSVQTAILPDWLTDKHQEYIITEGPTPGTIQVLTNRVRSKGLEDDIIKANYVLQTIARAQGLGPESVSMKYTYNLKGKPAQKRRLEEIKAITDKLNPALFPLRDRIVFEATA